jgi:hypothetical protein
MVDPRLERGFSPLLNRLRELAIADSADALLIRGSGPSFAAEVEAEAGLAEIVGSMPVVVVSGSWDPSGEPTLTSPNWSADLNASISLDAVRSGELSGMIRRSRALLRQEGVHYQLPSAAVHADAFIRLADAFQDPTDLVRMTDWVLPLVDERTGVIADTGSLLALLATIRAEAKVRFGWDIPIATMDEYPRSVDAVSAALSNFRAAGFDRLLCLVSVSSTGAVVELVRNEDPQAQIAVLVETDPSRAVDPGARANNEGQVHRFLDFPIERWPMDQSRSCAECPARNTMYIDPETYELRADLEWKPEPLDIGCIQRDRRFWEAVDRCAAVSLHVQSGLSEGARKRTRHLAVALNIPALLGDTEFRDECLVALGEIPMPDLILIPEHAAAESLAGLAEQRWGAVRIEVVALGSVRDRAAIFSDVEHVLVMDDVLISGETLGRLRVELNAVETTRGEPLDTWAYVVVARPWDRSTREAVGRRWSSPQDGAPPRRQLIYGKEVLLPKPGADQCPWCREREMLERRLLGLSDASRELAQRRLETLRASPLTAPLAPGGRESEHRTEGSIFGSLRPTAAFASASSHAQHLRESFYRQRGANTIRTLNRKLMIDAIWEPTLFGATLRTLAPREVHDHAREGEVAEALAAQSPELGLLYEMATGVSEGKLPTAAVQACITGAGLDPAHTQLLLGICGGTQPRTAGADASEEHE